MLRRRPGVTRPAGRGRPKRRRRHGAIARPPGGPQPPGGASATAAATFSIMAPAPGTFPPFSLEPGNAAKGRRHAHGPTDAAAWRRPPPYARRPAGAGRATTAVSAALALREGGDHANGTAGRAGREGMRLLDRGSRLRPPGDFAYIVKILSYLHLAVRQSRRLANGLTVDSDMSVPGGGYRSRCFRLARPPPALNNKGGVPCRIISFLYYA